MQRDAAVFRTQSSLENGVVSVDEVYQDFQHVKVKDRSLVRTTTPKQLVGASGLGKSVEHGPDRDAGAAEHPGQRADHDVLGGGAQGVARRARARGLLGARR
eukprot:59145-Rhodomonas_salina.1